MARAQSQIFYTTLDIFHLSTSPYSPSSVPWEDIKKRQLCTNQKGALTRHRICCLFDLCLQNCEMWVFVVEATYSTAMLQLLGLKHSSPEHCPVTISTPPSDWQLHNKHYLDHSPSYISDHSLFFLIAVIFMYAPFEFSSPLIREISLVLWNSQFRMHICCLLILMRLPALW